MQLGDARLRHPEDLPDLPEGQVLVVIAGRSRASRARAAPRSHPRSIRRSSPWSTSALGSGGASRSGRIVSSDKFPESPLESLECSRAIVESATRRRGRDLDERLIEFGDR